MSILILSCLSLIFLYVSSISIVFLLYQELWVPQYDLQLGLPGPGGWRCGDWDDPCLTWYNFYGHVSPETFWFLGRPVDARYDIAPMDQWHSVIPWVSECRLSAAVSFDLFLDPRPSTFRHTVEIWNQINFYIQQKVWGHRQVMGLLRPVSWQPFWTHDMGMYVTVKLQ